MSAGTQRRTSTTDQSAKTKLTGENFQYGHPEAGFVGEFSGSMANKLAITGYKNTTKLGPFSPLCQYAEQMLVI